MDTALDTLSARRHAQDLRDTWQGRALAAAKGKTGAVLLSILAHSYVDVLPTLMLVVFGSIKLAKPCLTTAGRIAKNGTIVADYEDQYGHKHTRVPLYQSELALRDEFRRLADQLKLSDQDRQQMFIAIQKWVVADYRLDPAMDPKDPDAKRLH